MAHANAIIPEDPIDPITPSTYSRYRKLAVARSIIKYKMDTRAVVEESENLFGVVLQVTLTPILSRLTETEATPFTTILKIAPKDTVRREQMEVVKHYRREVFMYEQVLPALKQLSPLRDDGTPLDVESPLAPKFDAVPSMIVYSLQDMDEYIILEDLSASDYVQNHRDITPTYDLVVTALEALAQLHARSLVLQQRQPAAFQELADNLGDNLFTRPMADISKTFGKYYISRAFAALEADEKAAEEVKKYHEETDETRKRERQENRQIIQVMKAIEQDFEEIAANCVDGRMYAPYAVICHGDFSNNNILYKYAPNGQATSAKLVDFQMSRFSPPVCDVLRYIFTCTEKSLRDQHFQSFLDAYHNSLVNQLLALGCSQALYPRRVFRGQLRAHGAYAFIIASFAMPFHIAIRGEFPPMERITEDLMRYKTPIGTAKPMSCRDLINRNSMLNSRSLPIFKRRMADIMRDLIKYELVNGLLGPPERR